MSIRKGEKLTGGDINTSVRKGEKLTGGDINISVRKGEKLTPGDINTSVRKGEKLTGGTCNTNTSVRKGEKLTGGDINMSARKGEKLTPGDINMSVRKGEKLTGGDINTSVRKGEKLTPGDTITSVRKGEKLTGSDTNTSVRQGEKLTGSDINTSVRKGELRYQYFVFCKECQCLQPGKLRVSCQSCKSGYIILYREFYFKCTGHQGEERETAAVLKHVRPNRKHRLCVVCSETGSPVMVFPCERRHVICLDCFKSYCVVRLNDRGFTENENVGYSLPCPVGCPNSLIEDPHHFCLLGVDQYERYKSFATEEYVLQNGGVLCPAVGCGSGFLLTEASRKVTCPTCQV
ncbi:E3 ubiquitin-protein ligase parkin-like isoform X2 [Mizuhopecten yessoensis]|uniref:E3 ubiquitin-protein ligase parkin-like isoform X2 n=1 Tax=Mizuhopecten yessoensis TaxID=6573 RepID=UPI000B459657|nr:E3 ubiquitin-protein ligase parkin-like isoform X2 [Mizuhopecten yessoensis]